MNRISFIIFPKIYRIITLYFLISAYPIGFAHSSFPVLAAFHYVAHNKRPVKRNKMVASGRLTDINFSDLYLNPILVKSGSPDDEFQ